MRTAPNFELPDENGQIRSLSDYHGRWLVLYFYPKDDTPGCTKEACAFRDARDLLAELGNCEVVGISKDTTGSHRRFKEKHQLNFTLLSDRSGEVVKAYRAWGEKTFMGRIVTGILRNTYIINPNGEIVREYEGVDPVKHIAQILADLKQLQA